MRKLVQLYVHSKIMYLMFFRTNIHNVFYPQLCHQLLTHVIHHLVVLTLSVVMVHVLVCQNTRETPMLGVDLNVSSVLTAQETELVSGTNVLTHVLALVVKEHVVMCWITSHHVVVQKVSLGILSFCAELCHVRSYHSLIICIIVQK
jgi:hypothetical protein